MIITIGERSTVAEGGVVTVEVRVGPDQALGLCRGHTFQVRDNQQ